MGQIIPICKLVVLAGFLGAPSLAAAKTEDAVNQYAAARLAEIGNRDGDALKGYIKLYRDAPQSAVLSDRIYDSAIRTGDMAAALSAVRAQELKGEVSGEAPLLIFANAFRQRNWSMALLAAEELSARSNFGFMTPILRSWVNVAQGKPSDLASADMQADPIFAYYSNDQRIYLQLATGEYSQAKLGLRGIAAVGGDYVRDVMLRAAPVIAAQGDTMFADALIGTAMGADRVVVSTLSLDKKNKARLSAEEGLSALHVRITAALLEQNVNDQALVMARIALWYAPDSEPAKLMLASALDVQGLNGQASALLQTIPQTSLYWPQAIKQRVAKLAPDEALMLSSDASLRWPKSQSLALLMAQSQEAAGDVTGASDSYRKIIDNATKGGTSTRQRAYYHLLLASALDNAGRWDDARAELDSALVIDPNNAQILNYLGYSLLERNKDIPRAMEMIRKAFEITPDSSAIIDSMGWAHFHTGDFAQAVTLLERAAKTSGNDLAINEHLGDAYWRTGRLRDARYAWAVASQTAEGDAVARLASKIDTGLTTR